MKIEILFTVEASADLPELGCVIGAFLPYLADIPQFVVGDPLVLELPDGRTLESHVRGLPMVNFGRKAEHIHFSIQLPKGLTSSEVPKGTNVFVKRKQFEGAEP